VKKEKNQMRVWFYGPVIQSCPLSRQDPLVPILYLPVCGELEKDLLDHLEFDLFSEGT
jgi:hypothetical protein